MLGHALSHQDLLVLREGRREFINPFSTNTTPESGCIKAAALADRSLYPVLESRDPRTSARVGTPSVRDCRLLIVAHVVCPCSGSLEFGAIESGGVQLRSGNREALALSPRQARQIVW